MKLWELNTWYGRRWIEQSTNALEVEAKEHCLEKRCWGLTQKHIFAKKANFQSFCALNTANSIIDLQGETLTNKLCLTKFLWEVLKYTQSGFALVLLQIPVVIYRNWRNGRNKRDFQEYVCLNLFCIVNCSFTILNLENMSFYKY